jgi:aldehyde dehydrogenase (NAD+)
VTVFQLGGKSPVVIDPRCDLETAAKRIMWGKCVNVGQTCVAPDYILVQEDAQDTVVQALKKAFVLWRYFPQLPIADILYRHDEFYPNGAVGSPDLSHIINKMHFDRIKGLLEKTSGTIAFGGETDESKLFIAPTVVKGVNGGDSLMSE